MAQISLTMLLPAMEGDTSTMSDLVVGSSKVPIILMHMRGTPKNMQKLRNL